MEKDTPLSTNDVTPQLGDVEQLRREVAQLRELVNQQLATIATLEAENKRQKGRIEQLESELASQKKLKGKPKLKASRLNESKASAKGFGKRPGAAKRSKKANFKVDKTQTIEPDERPEGAKLNQYREYDVQELKIERYNIRFLLGEYLLPDGTLLRAQLPEEYRQTGHYGPVLVSYILHEHYQNRVPQPLIYEQLQDWGVDISVGQINRMLTERLEGFHDEQSAVLQAGLSHSAYLHTDDTGARQGGKNGYCTVIGNEYFSYFASRLSKSRVNFLSVLQGGTSSYVLNEYAREYLETAGLAQKHWPLLSFGAKVLAANPQEWEGHLHRMGIHTPKAVRLITEAALLGGLIESGMSEEMRILSDGAGQFNLFVHALCWIHAERSIRKLEGSTVRFRDNIAEVQDLIWDYYQELKAYQGAPTEDEKARLSHRFDEIFGRCYLYHPTLSNALGQFRKKKDQLLRVLDFPDIPLHNNDAESAIREFVIRNKISGGTRSELGRKARDTMVGLKKTCRKLGVCFWEYLLSRVRGDLTIAPLADLIQDKNTRGGPLAKAA